MELRVLEIWFRSKPKNGTRRARLPLLLLGLCLIVSPVVAGQSSEATFQLQGTTFVLDSTSPSYIANVKVTLIGPVTMETMTDQDGKYEFSSVPAGTYTVEATAPGFLAKQVVSVETSKIAEVPLELKPSTIQDSITVTATADESTVPSPSTEITSRTLQNAPNTNDQTESILPTVPGVVRGPDGRINMKGARNTQSGALVNSVNATDPATGSPGIAVPIDVVASVQVISNPYDPQYGKLTGAVATLDTKTSDFKKFHVSLHNFMPRARVREGTFYGIGASTPRVTFTGPIWADHIAFTQSLEYRFVRTPVNGLPPLRRDTTLQSLNSYTQLDFNLTTHQTATVSLAVYPQKLQYLGLNTFTPQPSASNYHQRGYQLYGQHHYVIGNESLLTSQFSYKTFDVDLTPATSGAYRLLPETTEGGFFNLQYRRGSRFDWQETYQFAPRHFLGTHQWHAGLGYAYSTYNDRQTYLPVEIQGTAGTPIEQITFTGGSPSHVTQHEVTWFAGDHWTVFPRLLLDLGLRFDSDSVTSSAHAAPRAGFQLALTRSERTMLRGGVGEFYDRVPLMIPAFRWLPDRSVIGLNPDGQIASSTDYHNEITGGLRNPRSTAWNLALSQKVSSGLLLQVGYEQRNTARDFVISSVSNGPGSGLLTLSNTGSQSYKELQLLGRYHFRNHTVNGSYVHSRAYGDLNDFFQFFGNSPKPVIQPNAQGHLLFDAPNRFLFWGEFNTRWNFTVFPVYDVHTGFPYSVQDELRNYLGPRNARRYPGFSSFDLQVSRPVAIRFGGDRKLKARVGVAVFNLFNHFNPREVQSIEESARFGQYFNNSWREYRGKFTVEF